MYDEENVYKAPEANIELADDSFFPVSKSKLMVMYLITLGVYAVYWFYKNWKLQKVELPNVWPVPRGLFYIFFTHSLFRRVEEKASQKNIAHKLNLSSLATTFVLLVVVGNILGGRGDTITIADYISLGLFFVSVYPLLQVQPLINQINGDPDGRKNASYGAGAIAMIALGGILWTLVVIGLLVQV